MLLLRGPRDDPGSELAPSDKVFGCVEQSEAMGSVSSRSGLGALSGAKSDTRKPEDATLTLAAASAYDGNLSASGLNLGRVWADDDRAMDSSSNAFVFAIRAPSADVIECEALGAVDTAETDDAPLLADVELKVP